MTNKKSRAAKKLVISSASVDEIEMDYDQVITPYNLEFIEKILQGRQDIKNGKGVSIDIPNLWM